MYNRSWIIGRPVIYVVVDVFSGKIVGLYVGLEGPSWEGARLALLNTFLPKDEYLSRYGLDEEVNWSAHHIPVSVMADRAELLSENARGLITGLGIAIDIASGYRPDWKGFVERKFGILNDTVIHFMPGAVLKRNRERGERHYALDGTYNLYEFTRIIVREAIYFNAHHKYEDRRTPEMIRAGIKATPDTLWAFGMEHLIGGTPHRTRDEIYAHLLPQGNATVREDGIYFEGVRYTAPFAMQQRWFERARYHKRFSIPIRYNKEIPERIWILYNDESKIRFQIHEASLLDEHLRYTSLQLEEIQDLRTFEKLNRNDDEHSDLEDKIKKDVLNDKELKVAQEECRKSTSSKSRTQRSKNIRPQHAVEKQRQREEQRNYELEHFGKASFTSSKQANTNEDRSKARTTRTNSLILNMLQSDEELT
jgi:putative transposase